MTEWTSGGVSEYGGGLLLGTLIFPLEGARLGRARVLRGVGVLQKVVDLRRGVGGSEFGDEDGSELWAIGEEARRACRGVN